MERNPEQAKGAGSNPTSFWKHVAMELNAMGPAVKEAAAWKRTWIEKKSMVKKKLSHNRMEMKKTGGGKPNINKLNELEDRIAAITDMRAITARIEGSICVGLGKCNEDHRNDMDQSGSSHHTDAVYLPAPSHSTEPMDQPEPSYKTEPMDQPGPSHQGKRAKTAQAELSEFKKKILAQGEETNTYLREMSASI
uniref:Regulatory protein zeste n=1 Tax=Anopheles minimus TaxID=112268 RepID=A0A182WA71_9DIPT